MLARTHRNVAVVALANKLARIAWAALRKEQVFAIDHAPRRDDQIGCAARHARPTMFAGRTMQMA